MIMGCFIKKIFDKKTDESVHLQFQKFSRGEFDDRAMIRTKNSKGQFNMSTTAAYARDLVITLAENLGKEKTLVEGALVSAIKLDGFDYKEKKSAIGVNKYIIEKEMTGDEIIELANRFPKAFCKLYNFISCHFLLNYIFINSNCTLFFFIIKTIKFYCRNKCSFNKCFFLS